MFMSAPESAGTTARLLPVRRDSYSLFALMAPSQTLAEAGDPLRYTRNRMSRDSFARSKRNCVLRSLS